MSQPDSIGPIALIFKLNNTLVARGLGGLTDVELWRRPGDRSNPVGWILGHITATRFRLLARLGDDSNPEWGRGFGRGATLQDPSMYPSRMELEHAWEDTHARMRDAFAGLTAVRLTEPAGPNSGPGVTTLAEQLAFLAFHESYHVGQIAYVRKLLGHSGVVDR